MESQWDLNGVTVGPQWSHSGTTVESQWTSMESQWSHSGPQWSHSGPQWSHSGSTVVHSGNTVGIQCSSRTRTRTTGRHQCPHHPRTPYHRVPPHTAPPPGTTPVHHAACQTTQTSPQECQKTRINALGVLGKTTVGVYPAQSDMPGLTGLSQAWHIPLVREAF